jgi:hypothetical protein
MVRAKFVVQSIERQRHWDGTGREIQNIKLSAVTGGGDENKAFFAATPSGSITLGTVNADAAGEFQLGAEVYVDFTPAAPQSA